MAMRRRRFLGQHMLTDTETIDYEVAMARPDGCSVLEIGGGTGNLTASILGKAKRVEVVEKDPEMADKLRSRFRGKKGLRILEGDFLELEPGSYKAKVIMGNIPYSVSSQILSRLREWKFERAVLCVQKEFAERMVAKPCTKDYSRLSVMSQTYFNPVYLKTVPKSSFDPVPEVDSALVLLFPNRVKPDRGRDGLVTKLFTHKRKTLAAAIKSREFSDSERAALTAKAKKLGLLEKRIFCMSLYEISELADNR